MQALCDVGLYYIIAFTQVCRKRQMKGGLEFKLIFGVLCRNCAPVLVNFGLESNIYD